MDGVLQLKVSVSQRLGNYSSVNIDFFISTSFLIEAGGEIEY